jgi:hypothetical protein
MNPLVLSVTIPSSVLQFQIGSTEEIVDGPSTDVPELKALHHYAGDWEDEITGKPGMRRTESGAWILRGRFLRQSWSTEAGDGSPTASGLTLMTFDVERRVYRNWSFLATGSVIENEGVWNPEERSFIWGRQVIETAENMITKAIFEEDGTQAWSLVKTGVDGKVLREVTGRSRRKGLPTLQAA